jgi:hypothetical protein
MVHLVGGCAEIRYSGHGGTELTMHHELDMETVRIVLGYYIFFWVVNSAAYWIVCYGMYRLSVFTAGFAMHRTLTATMWVTGLFGTARLSIGAVGVGLYMANISSPFTTILIMGMSSLLLNTVFILGEGLYLNREVKTTLRIVDTPANRELITTGIRKFEALRQVVKHA